jgi:glycerol-3-phosphate dehydrogenase
LLPIFTKDGLFPRRIARALGSALWAYDTAGGWRIGRLHRRIRRGKVADLCPGLPSDRVAGGYLYFDARADDARLTLDVARTAAHHGAIVVNHCPVRSITTANGEVASVVVDLDGESLTIPTRTVINAAGVWAQAVDDLLDAPLSEPLPPIAIRPARGVHVSIPWELVRNSVAVVLPVPGDRRSVFLIPSGQRPDGTFDIAYVGTTDTDHEGGLDDPQCTNTDVEYLLRAVNHSLGHRIDPSQVLGVWAGLRPLVVPTDDNTQSGGGPRTADLSRRHRVDASPSGAIRVIGGKLTTYRQMAQDTVDELDRIIGKRGSCITARTRITGRDEADVASIAAQEPERGRPLADGVQLTHADVIASIRFELATSLTDVLTRRTRLHIDDRSRAMAIAPAVATTMAAELGWDDDRRTTEINAYLALCEAERIAAAESA